MVAGLTCRRRRKTMANLTIENILTLTLEDAYKWYEEFGLGFCIKDGKISGFYKNV